MASLGLQHSMEHTLSLIERCSCMAEIRQIHAQMFKTGLISEMKTVSKLLSSASSPEFGDLHYANTIFERIHEPNTFMWNAMIRGYAGSNMPEQAWFLYHQMLFHSVSHNAHTFPYLLKACSCLSVIEETQQLHAQIIKLGFDSDVYTLNSLLHAYAASSSIQSARIIFDRIPQPDVVSWNSVIGAYMKCGDIEIAHELFKDMPEKNAISFTVMISGHIKEGLDKEALEMFQEMQVTGIKPDKIVLTNILSVCANLGSLDQGRWIHAYIKKNGIHIDTKLVCVLIDMYAKCGSMQDALEVFERTEKKNIFIWTALIYGFAIHGHSREALHSFMQLHKEGLRPNLATFTAILTACSHAGLIEEGKSIFGSMEKVYGLKPTEEHYGCMVDLLGRSGLFMEAEDLIKRMPIKPNAVIWGALLNVCQIHGNINLGKKLGKLLIQGDPYHGGRYIHLARIHAASGEWNEAVEARRTMKGHGISKLPGCSTVSVDGIVHAFFAGDNSHAQIEEIKCMCKMLQREIQSL